MSNTIQRDPSCADDYDFGSISIEQARSKILDNITPIIGGEKISIKASLGRVLAEDIHSPLAVPGHNNSAMDGYALIGADLPNDNDGFKPYQLIGTALAGSPFTDTCVAGQAVRIMTGAMIPAGCDTVVMQEHVEVVDETTVKIGSEHQVGQNVRHAGEDIEKGALVLSKGRRITAADLGLLASLGIGEVKIVRRPRIAFFSTGDELRSVGETLGQGDIYDSNRYTLYGMLKRLDVDILDMGIIKDDPNALRAAFEEASAMADVIITSGGVSVGEADYVKNILEEMGNISFWKVGMKPGRPLTVGNINKAHFFGLPGNPVSVMVTFYQFVQPAIHYLASGFAQYPVTLNATCASALSKRAGRFEFQRGIYEQGDEGELLVTKTGNQGSGVLSSMSYANCFILLPVETTRVEPGERIQIQPFGGFI